MKKLEKDHTDVKDFMNRVKETNVECGKYIQSKVSLENETLKAFSAIDPLLVCSPNKLVLKRLLPLSLSLSLSLSTDSYCFGRRRGEYISEGGACSMCEWKSS